MAGRTVTLFVWDGHDAYGRDDAGHDRKKIDRTKDWTESSRIE